MESVHQRGWGHFDLKPENILYSTEVEEFWVADLGLSLSFEPDGLVEVCSGTPGYIAPEVWRQLRAGPKADVFSLGCVLYELLAHRHLFSSGGEDDDLEPVAMATLKGVAPESFNPPIFSGLCGGLVQTLIQAMCEVDPRKRPSAGSVAGQLEVSNSYKTFKAKANEEWLYEKVEAEHFAKQVAVTPAEEVRVCAPICSIVLDGTSPASGDKDGCAWWLAA